MAHLAAALAVPDSMSLADGSVGFYLYPDELAARYEPQPYSAINPDDAVRTHQKFYARHLHDGVRESI